MTKRFRIAIFLVLVLLAAAGCQRSSPAISSTPLPAKTEIAAVSTPGSLAPLQGHDVSVPVQVDAASAAAEAITSPTEAPAPTSTSQPIFQQLKVKPQQIGKKAFVLTIENPNQDVAVKDTQYQVVGYDSAGAVIESTTLSIGYVFPGEQYIRVASLFNPQSPDPAKLELVLSREGQAEPSPYRGSIFHALEVLHKQKRNVARVTGVVQNSADFSVTNPLLTVLAFNEKNEVIAAKTEPFFGFIPAQGQAAVETSLYDVEPARVELYAGLQGTYTIHRSDANYQPLQVGDVIGVQGLGGVASALFFVTNPNQNEALVNMQYQASFYGIDGSVLGVTSNFIPLVFPGERMAVISNNIANPGDAEIGRAEVTIIPVVEEANNLNDFKSIGVEKNPVTAIDPQYAGDFVTCTLRSAWKNEINAVSVVVVLFDDSGNVIGMGSQSQNRMPANGEVAMKIRVNKKLDFVGAPARIELYASASSATDIR